MAVIFLIQLHNMSSDAQLTFTSLFFWRGRIPNNQTIKTHIKVFLHLISKQ